MSTTTTSTSGSFGSELKRSAKAYPTDERVLLRLFARPEQVEFIKSQTGIQDEDELKGHVLSIQKEAYEIFPYQCIRFFAFAAHRITTVPNYGNLIKLGRERDHAVFLDLGCCFGTDTRKVVADGWPVENVIASDIHAQFWDLGHKLYRSNSTSFPAVFIQGDALTDAHLSLHPVLPTSTSSPDPPTLSNLTSLNPLAGRVSAIYVSAVFHLFPAEGQSRLARALAGLLSPLPGSMISGSHNAAPDGQEGVSDVLQSADGIEAITQFRHSPSTWKALWDGEVFEKGTVKVDTELDVWKSEGMAGGSVSALEFYVLRWSVTRL